MFIDEYVAKDILRQAGIEVPAGAVAANGTQAAAIAKRLGTPVAVKSLVPAGRRGKHGGIRFAETPQQAREAAEHLLGSTLGEHLVDQVLVEQRIPFERELYAAVTNDAARKCPLVLFAAQGGTDIEEIHASSADAVAMLPLDIRRGLETEDARRVADNARLDEATHDGIGSLLGGLYRIYRQLDAELVEVNPLAVTAGGRLVALDCKLVVDDGALHRHPALPPPSPVGTLLERRASKEGLIYVELDGDVGVLANGAGLTMATMDAIAYYGGRPANFMEIGGEAYKKAASALSIVLAHPGVKSLLVNLCGAFARTDVMVEGIVAAWQQLQPHVPVAFSIHGTGEHEAILLVEKHMGITPYDKMHDAVRAAIRMATDGR